MVKCAILLGNMLSKHVVSVLFIVSNGSTRAVNPCIDQVLFFPGWTIISYYVYKKEYIYIYSVTIYHLGWWTNWSITWTQPTDRSIEPGASRSRWPARATWSCMRRTRGSTSHAPPTLFGLAQPWSSRLLPTLPRDWAASRSRVKWLSSEKWLTRSRAVENC
jgi:hypothetical protein